MPTTRPRAQQENRTSMSVDTDPGSDTERDEPRPSAGRTVSRKRLSERIIPDGNSSNANAGPSSDGRPPLKAVQPNDDAAEKRRRRKSTKPVYAEEDDDAEPEGGLSGAIADDAPDGARPNKGRPTLMQQPSSQLASVAQAPIIKVPLDVMSSNFDQWMKMATDNKINAANTWNFALIDYFHDMSLLRNNTDNSINFQRASCTLDGCVKIWTSRVDSVGTDTGKLLSNLANDGREDEEEGGLDEAGNPSQGQRNKRKNRSESTLAKNPSQVRSKKQDLEFTVDPLFKKTCADFDEGGAQGLLMNHLGLYVHPDGSLRVVFDAGDSVAQEDEEEAPLEEPVEDIDLSYLRATFLPDIEEIDEQEISHSLESFHFGMDGQSIDTTAFFRHDPEQHDDDDDDEGNDPFNDGVQGPNGDAPMDVDEPVADFFADPPADDYTGGEFGGEDYGDSGSVGGSDDVGEGSSSGQGQNRASKEGKVIVSEEQEGQGLLDYFDENLLNKNWAGAKHWKLRQDMKKADTSGTAPKAKREKKEAFKIDFFTPLGKDIKERKEELFAKATRGAGINLPGPSTGKGTKKGARTRKVKEKRKEQTLPDDLHFQSRAFVTLFLKPKFEVKTRKQRGKGRALPDGEIDENYWAQATAQAGNDGGENGDETVDGGVPFNTQFFQDDDDDVGGFDDGYEGPYVDPNASTAPDEQDLLAGSQRTRRVKPERVNYAKRAKRVDVRKLKDNIWKGLDIVAPGAEEVGEMDDDNRPLTDPSEARTFTNVISGLRTSYPKEKMDEISTSFCFICLLHLANERGLKLEVAAKTEDETAMEVDQSEADTKVGNLWDLKVYRDPNATPAA